MTESIGPEKTGKKTDAPQPGAEPGLFDTIGSFPVWLLKVIDFFTPASLIKRPSSPPEKKNPPR